MAPGKPVTTASLALHWGLIFALSVAVRLIVRRHDPVPSAHLALFTTGLVLSMYAGRWWRARHSVNT